MSSFLVNEKIILTNNSSNQDAFDRLRTSYANALFQYDLSLGQLPFLIDEFLSASGATMLIDTSIPTIDLKLTGGVTGKAIRQSYEYVPYQPGKSKLMMFSGILEAVNGGITGVISRIGCFDSAIEKGITGNGNGLFFELNNKTLNVVERLNDVDTKVAQNAWNNDKFDGTGPSGITGLNFSKVMIFAIDQEWLGSGNVRFGFVINGSFKLAHSYNHSGIGTPVSTAISMPYTKTAKLPVRYEISSTVANTATLRMLSSTVLSEGGYEPTGMHFSVGTTGHILTSTTTHPILSIRLRENEPYNRKTASLRKLSTLIYNTGGAANPIQWDLYILPNENSLIGTPNWQNVNDNSIVQYDINSTGIRGITANDDIILLAAGYADSTTINEFEYEKYLASPLLNSSINGKSKILCLSAIELSGGAGNRHPTVCTSLSWVEIL
jgi:hypothetical protein